MKIQFVKFLHFRKIFVFFVWDLIQPKYRSLIKGRTARHETEHLSAGISQPEFVAVVRPRLARVMCIRHETPLLPSEGECWGNPGYSYS